MNMPVKPLSLTARRCLIARQIRLSLAEAQAERAAAMDQDRLVHLDAMIDMLNQRMNKRRQVVIAARDRSLEPRNAAHALEIADANGTSQRCTVCNAPYSPFGFGPPHRSPPKATLWACRSHQEETQQKAGYAA